MAAEKPQLVLVQISDLHFGEIDPATGDAKSSSLAAKIFANTTIFDGVLGHHGRALQDLEEFCSRLRSQEQDVTIVVSGDLTRCGNSVEYAVAKDFLTSKVDLSPPSGNLVGLQLRGCLAIPGNHD